MDFSPYRKRYRPMSEPTHWAPFLWGGAAILLGVGIFFGLQHFFFQNTAEASLPKLYSEQLSRGEILPRDGTTWMYRDKPVDVWESDSVRSLFGTTVYLSFVDGSLVYLDQGAELTLQSSKKNTRNGTDAVLLLKKGGLWVEGAVSSTITVILSDRVRFEMSGGVFMLSSEGVRVLNDSGSGSTLSYLGTNGEVMFSKRLSIGQEVILSPQNLIVAEQTSAFTVTPISPDFYETALYKTRMKNPGSPSPISDLSASPSPSSSPTPTDLSSLPAPTITSPGKNGETVSVKGARQEISGTVPVGTAKIMVTHKESQDEHELAQFQPGDTSWKYIAHALYGNLLPGTNTYTVVAIDKEGKKSLGASLVLDYTGDAAAPVASALRITTPNNGNDTTVSKVPVTLTGTAPELAAYIEVNDYRLQKFKLGDTSWSYIATPTDKKTVYTVRALDKNGRFLSSDKMTITFTAGNSPVAIPTAKPSTKPTEATTPAPTVVVPKPVATPAPTPAPTS
ncbi:MAG: hypothetical protein WCJ84_02160 [Candidatus Peregrinibacteria bacterium]